MSFMDLNPDEVTEEEINEAEELDTEDEFLELSEVSDTCDYDESDAILEGDGDEALDEGLLKKLGSIGSKRETTHLAPKKKKGVNEEGDEEGIEEEVDDDSTLVDMTILEDEALDEGLLKKLGGIGSKNTRTTVPTKGEKRMGKKTTTERIKEEDDDEEEGIEEEVDDDSILEVMSILEANRDGTGPNGDGPNTGRGAGPCKEEDELDELEDED